MAGQTFGDELMAALPWLGVLVLLLLLLAVIAVLGPGISGDYPAQPAPVDEEPADCVRCGGSGWIDLLDDGDRPTAYDVPCPSCTTVGEGWL